MTARTIMLMAALIGSSVTCSSSNPYDPDIPAAWAAAVTHPLYPLVGGTTYYYEAQTAQGLETDSIQVLAGTEDVNGVAATKVWDRLYLDGVLIEETYDWFAQDVDGNVWYLGEDTKEYENGQVVSTEGSWTWGVNGGLPGIIMWADPTAHVGERYRQEFLKGEAEDMAKVIAVNENVSVPYGDFTGCLKTEDWSGLTSGGHEYKYYCAGVGNVLETTLTGTDRVELKTVTP